jgi:hypothetical protein
MDISTKFVSRNGSTAPGGFPHVCPFSERGASKGFCAEQTANFSRNRDGCCATKCTSEVRKCIMCLSLMRDRRLEKTAVDAKLGLCAEHLLEYNKPNVKATKDPARSPRLQSPPPRPLVPPPPQQAPTPLRPSEAVIVAALTQVRWLNKRKLTILRFCGLGLENAEIARKISATATAGSIGVEFTAINYILGIKRLSRIHKRQTAIEVARRHFVNDPEYKNRK